MILLDIGCGRDKKSGYIGVDKAKLPGVDIICDIEYFANKFPSIDI